MKNKQPKLNLVMILYILVLVIQSALNNSLSTEVYPSGNVNDSPSVNVTQTSSDLIGTLYLGIMLTILFFVALSIMLISMIIRRRSRNQKISTSSEEPLISLPRSTISIIGLFRRKRLQNLHLAGIALSIAIISYQILLLYRLVESSMTLSLVLFSLLMIVVIHILSFDFRVGSGLYGNNASEAIDIMRFIQQELRTNNFTGGGTSQSLYIDEDLNIIPRAILRPIR